MKFFSVCVTILLLSVHKRKCFEKLCPFNLQNMLELDQTSPLWSDLCPSAKGAILLYQTVKPDGKEDYFKQPPTQ